MKGVVIGGIQLFPIAAAIRCECNPFHGGHRERKKDLGWLSFHSPHKDTAKTTGAFSVRHHLKALDGNPPLFDKVMKRLLGIQHSSRLPDSPEYPHVPEDDAQ